MGLAHSLRIGALLAGVLVLYYVFMVSESEIWETDVERKRREDAAQRSSHRARADAICCRFLS